ncbi:RNA-directed DNA polymerase, eukaryota, reverse transcriptase zinc-binding domain protein [Tanacetum coccineum]
MFGIFMFFEAEESTVMSSGRICISTRSYNFVSEKVHVKVHGENFEAHVHKLGTWSINITDDSIDTSSHINVKAIEKVVDSVKKNSVDDLNDLNDNLNELAHGINEDEVQMDNPNTTMEQLQFFEKEKDHNDFNLSKVSESSDPSHPPGFDHMKNSLSNTSLIDLPIGGHLYTWMNKAGTKLSKLDRFLISDEVLEIFLDISITALDRLWSDHTPILFHILKSAFGPIPFKLYNSWLSHDGFDDVIKAAWSSLKNHNNDGRILMSRKKLQSHQEFIKQWYVNFNDIDRIRKHDAMSYVKSVEKRIKDGIATPSDRDTRMQLLQEIDKLDNFEALNLIQKALINGTLKETRTPNSEYLENHVSLDEIKSAIWDCGSNKAHDPDGFTFAFLKKYWDLIKMDILEFTVKKPSQTSRYVSVGPKMGFKPQKEYRLVPKKTTVSSSGNKKKGVEPTIEVSNSNPFDVLSLVDNDVEFGTNKRTTNLVNNGASSSGSSFMNVDNSSSGTTPIIGKIRKFEDLLTSGQAILVDKAGNPLKKVEFLGEYDSDDEVASVDNNMARSTASERVGFGTQSLLEQWRDSYGNGDYDDDPYDDDMYEGQDLSHELQAICDNLDIRARGRKKK